MENRDILAVCERLNIAVKSHSSTITESDAQRIEKYVASHPIENHSDSKSDQGSQPSKHSDSQTNSKKKQQILEIRKPKLQVNSNSKRLSTQEHNSESQSTTQAQSSDPSLLSSEKPTLLERPVLSKPNTIPQPPVKPASQPQAEESQTDDQAPVQPTEAQAPELNQPQPELEDSSATETA
ncbi:MAG: translation initiation factor IF-2, partial [Cyanobacteriota bacterium]|nr:translation initiation factor IF-2 [Cyanobacteriota bacterium]